MRLDAVRAATSIARIVSRHDQADPDERGRVGGGARELQLG